MLSHNLPEAAGALHYSRTAACHAGGAADHAARVWRL